MPVLTPEKIYTRVRRLEDAVFTLRKFLPPLRRNGSSIVEETAGILGRSAPRGALLERRLRRAWSHRQ